MTFDLAARRATSAFTTFALLVTTISAEDGAPATAPVPSRPSRIELRDKQYDVSLDARDIERILLRLKRASELSKQRMTEAAAAAESVAGTIENDPNAAQARAEVTAKMFQEIAKLLEALLTEETPQRVAAARNIAAQLAKAEQQFAQQTQALSQAMMQSPTAASGQGKADPKQPPMPNKGNGQGGSPSQPSDPEAQSGNTPQETTPPQTSQGTGNNPGETEPKENPNGTGGKPDRQKPLEDGQGSGGTDPDDKHPAEKRAGGTGDTKDDENSKEKPAGGGRGEKRPLTEEERRDQLAGRATDLAARAATLLDILESIAQSQMPEDQTAAQNVAALLKETDLKNAVAAMQASADQIRNQKLEDARATALDVADRFQITTQRLDAVYRAVVGPQAEELRQLEQQLVQLRTKLEELQTPAQVVAWHRAVAELLDKADELGVNEKRREELLEEMKQNGFSVGSTPNTARLQFTDGRYVAPPVYNAKLISLQEEIQARIQSLVLGEFASMTDDLAPPKYQGLVERYYQVLSQEGRPRPDTSGAAPTSEKK